MRLPPPRAASSRLALLLGLVCALGLALPGPGQAGVSFARVAVPVGQGPLASAVGDLNGDGRLDLATANYDAQLLAAFLGNGAGGFAYAGAFATASGPRAVALGDLAGDGRLDLATGGWLCASDAVLLGTGTGSFAPWVEISTQGCAWALAAGDLDGDGRPDLLGADLSGGTGVAFRNTTLLTGPSFVLGLNAAAYAAGRTITLGAAVAPDLPRTVDVYVALQFPDGSLLFLQGDGSLTGATLPIVAGWSVAAFSGQLFSHTFAGTEPTGAYTWLAGTAQPGTLTFIGPIVEVPFTFAP